MNKELLDFINLSPTPFQAVDNISQMLEGAGYLRLSEGGAWTLERGKGYFVTRNLSSIIAFRVPAEGFSGFMITASHCDSPAFKLREKAETEDSRFTRLSVEGYGGMIYSTWLDRPLGVAGRVIVKNSSGIETRLVDLGSDVCLIPNVAIHMNRSVNKDTNYNPAVDLQPLYSMKGSGKSIRARAAEAAGADEGDIIACDLFLYNPQKGACWGDFISAPRLDDLQCAYSSVAAFLSSEGGSSVPVCAVFDNEEVGSHTKQGAASTFLKATLTRISAFLGGDLDTALASSLMLSCDNAHSIHPNHPEYADKNEAPVLNGGVVVKFNAAQKYTSDAVSYALFKMIAEEAGAEIQLYANRPDIPGGGTLGNIANAQVSLNTVDIGLAQLAMHSSFETAGAKDTETMVKALRLFFEKSVVSEGDGSYRVI